MPDDLQHFGVKGMHWGQRKTPDQMTTSEKAARIKQLNKKMDRLDMDAAITGIGVRGYYASKMHEKALKKDPGLADRKPIRRKGQELADFNRTLTRKARNGVLLRGVPQLGLIVAGGAIGISKLAKTPRAVQGGKAMTALLAINGAKIMYADLHGINTADKRERILAEISELEPKRTSKKR